MIFNAALLSAAESRIPAFWCETGRDCIEICSVEHYGSFRLSRGCLSYLRWSAAAMVTAAAAAASTAPIRQCRCLEASAL